MHGIGGSNVHCVENRNLDGYILIVLFVLQSSPEQATRCT